MFSAEALAALNKSFVDNDSWRIYCLGCDFFGGNFRQLFRYYNQFSGGDSISALSLTINTDNIDIGNPILFFTKNVFMRMFKQGDEPRYQTTCAHIVPKYLQETLQKFEYGIEESCYAGPYYDWCLENRIDSLAQELNEQYKLLPVVTEK
jgi:hypothetical protein